MADLISRNDFLNEGRVKINNSIKDANQAKQDAIKSLARSLSAEQIAQLAKLATEDTQRQLDNIIIENGTSDAEVIQARDTFPLLKDRLNHSDTQFLKTGEQVTRNKDYTGISHKEMHKREIVLELPGRFEEYSTIMMTHSEYLHTQAFTVLEEDNLLFILFVPPPESTMSNRWIAVYEWSTGKYLSCFGLVSEAWEGIVVKYENDKRFLYVAGSNPVRDYDLHKYDITDLPNNTELLSDYVTITLGVYHRFNYHNGKWIVIKDIETNVKSNGSRSLWQILDDDFNVVKTIRVDGEMRSLMNARTTNTFPKVQGLGIGSDFYVASVGATTQGNNVSRDNLQQGLVLLDAKGNIIKRGLMDNEKLFNKYISLGYNPNKVENEGVWVSGNDDIYTLNVINTSHPEKGLLIVKEGANNESTKDFSDTATPLFSLDVEKYGDRYFPVEGDYFINPITQERFTNISEMVAFARDYDLPSLSVYVAAETDLLGVNNEELSSVYFHFKNTNSFSLFGTETSLSGQRNLLFSRDSIRVLPSGNRQSLIDSPVTVEKDKVIELNDNIDNFNKLEIIYQSNGYNNKVHSFQIDPKRYDIRDFNLADDSSAVIVFFEVLLERVSGGNRLQITKCNRQTNSGTDSAVKTLDNVGSQYIVDIIGVY